MRDLAVLALIKFQELICVFDDDDDGQTLAEYGLITSMLVVAVIVVAVVVFKDAIVTSIERAADCVAGGTECPR